MQLPLWYLALQILIPAAVGVVAWAQWHTASPRVTLDLFDRRLRVFKTVSDLTRQTIGSAKVGPERVREITAIWQESRFLFGPEVADALLSLINAMWDLETSNYELADGGPDPGPERTAEVKKRRDAITRIESLQMQFPDLFHRYMRMDTKVVRSPRQWLHDVRKRQRASAGEGRSERDSR